MLTGEEVRTKINQYLYLLNKFNIYGVIAAYCVSMTMGTITLPSGTQSAIWQHASNIAFIVFICVVVKTVILKTTGVKDSCECNMKDKDYTHPKVNTCPTEETLRDVYTDLRYVAEEFAINICFRYNLAAVLLIFAVAHAGNFFQISSSFLNIFNIAAIIGLVIFGKLALNYFFYIQDFCPCHCKYNPTTTSSCGKSLQQTLKETGREVKTEISDMKKGLVHRDNILEIVDKEVDEAVSSGAAENKLGTGLEQDQTIDDLEKAVERELRAMLPSEEFGDRLRTMCEIAAVKLKRWDTVDTCLAETQKNEDTKAWIKKLLMDDPTYVCLRDSVGDTQFESCFRDYFNRHPEMMLRLIKKLSTSA